MRGDISVLLAAPAHSIATNLAESLDREGDRLAVEPVAGMRAGLDLLEERTIDCVVATDGLGAGNGIEFLETVSDRAPEVPLIFFPTDGSESLASRAITAGVSEYVTRTGEAGAVSAVATRIEEIVGGNQTARAFRRAEARYRDLFAAMNEGMALHELVTDESGTPVDFRVLEVNQRYEEILDTDREAVEGALASTVYETEDPPFLERFSRVVETGEPIEFETEYAPLHKHFQISVFRPEPGRFATIFSDITDRKRAKQQLQAQTRKLEEEVSRREAAESRYRSLFENNPVIIWEEDFSGAKAYVDAIADDHPDVAGYLDTHPEEIAELFDRIEIIDINEKALSYYGAESKAELIENFDQLIAEGSRAANRELWQTVADGRTQFRSETVSRTLDGQRRDEILEYRVPADAAEDYSRVYVTAIDITERKARERELEQLKERLQLALEGAHLGVWDWNMETGEVFRDERWAAMLGYEPGVIEGTFETFKQLLHPDDIGTHQAALDTHLAGESEYYHCDYRLQTVDGSWKWIQNLGKVVEWADDGTPRRAVGIHQDVDEKRRTRERLEQNNELLQAVDRILRHNLHNDMNVVQGYARTIEERADGRVHAHARKIIETSQKLLETVDKERSVVESLSDPQKVKPVDIVQVVESVIAGVKNEHPTAEITVEAPDTVSVRAVETIGRAIEELIENGIQHDDTSPAVDIDIETGNGQVWVRVADTAPPIPEMERGVLTEDEEITPLYHGSGFGLWLVSHVVRRSDGDLTFDERVPRGNVVTIELQRVE